MGTPLDTTSPAGGQITRGRGGFMRNAADVPYVTDPTGATVKTGPRRGQPKRIPYGSPSNRGKQIENGVNLVKWGERRVVLGVGRALLDDPALLDDAKQLTVLDVDSDDYKTLADTLILRCKKAAEATLAADRGTHGHALTEDHDEGRDWVARAEAGEDLGIGRDAQRGLVAAWHHMLAHNQLEVLATEASCVDDLWRLAGTLDRIVRTRCELRFALDTGMIVTVPAGTVLVLDVKTGQRRIDKRTGTVLWWQAYAIQIASYAQSIPYDTVTETRGEWPWQISQDHALIAHLDVLGAIAGTPACTLVYVDLAAGREHGGQCVVDAKAWEARTDLFSVTQLDPGVVVPPATTTPDPCPSALPPATAGPADTPVDDFDTPLTTSPPAATAAAAPEAGGGWLRATQQTIADVDRDADIRRRIRRTPCEGETVHLDDAFNSLQDEGRRLPDAGRLWVGRLVNESMTAGRSFRFKTPGERSARRWWIARGLVTLAAAGHDGDDIVRALLSPIIGPAAFSTDHTLGHLVGTLDDSEAARFAGACSVQTSTEPARSVA